MPGIWQLSMLKQRGNISGVLLCCCIPVTLLLHCGMHIVHESLEFVTVSLSSNVSATLETCS